MKKVFGDEHKWYCEFKCELIHWSFSIGAMKTFEKSFISYVSFGPLHIELGYSFLSKCKLRVLKSV